MRTIENLYQLIEMKSKIKNNQTIVIFFILILLFSFSVKSQTSRIDSLKIIPVNPTPNDTVKVVCFSKFSSGFCSLSSDSMNVTGLTFQVYASHNTGTLAVICYSIDTFIVGKLDSGFYQLIYHLSDFITPVDTDTVAFIVQEPLSLQFKNRVEKFELFPNPTNSSHTIIFKSLREEEIQINLFNLFGRNIQNVYRGKLSVGLNTIVIDISDLNPALYFYEIRYGNKIEHFSFLKQ